MDLLASLSWWAVAWIGLVTLMSGFVHGALGFGYPLIAMPLLYLVLDAKAAIVIILLPTFVLSIANAIIGGRWSESIVRFWYLPLAIMTGAFFGTRIVITADPAPFMLLLALVLLLYLNINRLGGSKLGWMKRVPVPATIVAGLLGGWVESSTNMNLPVLLILFQGLEVGPRAMVQVANFCGIGGKAAQMAGWSTTDDVTIAFWMNMLPWVGLSAIGLATGARIRIRIEPATYMRWLRAFLWVMAVALLMQFAVLKIYGT
ncbi:MAG: sulfite exporter TauE/SafE family protein [Burkholderiales bacterium]